MPRPCFSCLFIILIGGEKKSIPRTLEDIILTVSMGFKILSKVCCVTQGVLMCQFPAKAVYRESLCAAFNCFFLELLMWPCSVSANTVKALIHWLGPSRALNTEHESMSCLPSVVSGTGVENGEIKYGSRSQKSHGLTQHQTGHCFLGTGGICTHELTAIDSMYQTCVSCGQPKSQHGMRSQSRRQPQPRSYW